MIKLILVMTIFLSACSNSEAGTTLAELSKTMVVINLRDAEEVLRVAKESSQKAMSKDRIKEIKDEADESLGAFVFCSSTIVR